MSLFETKNAFLESIESQKNQVIQRFDFIERFLKIHELNPDELKCVNTTHAIDVWWGEHNHSLHITFMFTEEYVKMLFTAFSDSLKIDFKAGYEMIPYDAVNDVKLPFWVKETLFQLGYDY